VPIFVPGLVVCEVFTATFTPAFTFVPLVTLTVKVVVEFAITVKLPEPLVIPTVTSELDDEPWQVPQPEVVVELREIIPFGYENE
jgi:hypothetical protein